MTASQRKMERLYDNRLPRGWKAFRRDDGAVLVVERPGPAECFVVFVLGVLTGVGVPVLLVRMLNEAQPGWEKTFAVFYVFLACIFSLAIIWGSVRLPWWHRTFVLSPGCMTLQTRATDRPGQRTPQAKTIIRYFRGEDSEEWTLVLVSVGGNRLNVRSSRHRNNIGSNNRYPPELTDLGNFIEKYSGIPLELPDRA